MAAQVRPCFKATKATFTSLYRFVTYFLTKTPKYILHIEDTNAQHLRCKIVRKPAWLLDFHDFNAPTEWFNMFKFINI